MNDWPRTSAPRTLPKVNFYFSGGGVFNFAEVWQGGVFLRRLMRETSVEFDDYVARYDLGDNEVSIRFNGATSDEMMEASHKRPLDMPWDVDNQLRMVLGRERRTFAAYEAGVERVEGKKPVVSERVSVGKRKSSSRGAARPARDGLVSLTTLCADAKVKPGDVRAVLRKRKVEKPEVGWAFPEGDPLLAVVDDAISAVRAGNKA